jgi:putative acetyltransferase
MKNKLNDPQLLRQVSRELIRELGVLDNDCCETSLTPVQAHSLIEINNSHLTVKALSNILLVDKSNASRTVSKLIEKNLIIVSPHPNDARSQLLEITSEGKRLLNRLDQRLNSQSTNILAQMTADEKIQLHSSLHRYLKSIRQSKQQQAFTIRPLIKDDDIAIADVIRNVSEEFGLSACKGYGVSDPNLENFSHVYAGEQNQYWVIEYLGKIVGGGGAEQLSGESGVCELNKMYFLPEARGFGLSRRLAIMIIEFAKTNGYTSVYLETTHNLREALYLYKSLGFEKLEQPLGNTGHGDCELAMLLKF